MKTTKRVLSALMVLAMLLSCMGAAPLDAEQEPADADAAVSEPETAPAAEPAASEPETTEPGTTEPAADGPAAATLDEEPAGEPEAEPTGEQATEPAGEQVTEPAGEPGAAPNGEPEAAPNGEQATEPAGEQANEPTAEDGTGAAPTFTLMSSSGGMMPLSGGMMPLANDVDVIPSDQVDWENVENTDYTGEARTAVTAKLKSDYPERSNYDSPDAPTTLLYVNEDGTYSSETPPTDAGTYTVTATWSKSGGAGKGSSTKTFTINPVTLTITTKIDGTTNAVTPKYTGTVVANSPTAEGSGFKNSEDTGVTISAFFVKDGAEAIPGNKVTPIDVGIYRVGYEIKWTTAKEKNYTVTNAGTNENLTLTIEQIKLTLTLNNDLQKPFTGSEIVLTKDDIQSAPEIASGDSFESVTINEKNVQAAGPVTFKSAVINATRDGQTVNVAENYNPVEIKGNLEITALDLKDAVLTSTFTKEIVYDGKEHEQPIELMIDKYALTTDDYDVAYETEDPSHPENVGAVTVTVTRKVDNLTGGPITFTYNIIPREITVTAQKSVTYTGEEQTVQLTQEDDANVENLAEGHTLKTLTASVKGKDRGSYSTKDYETIVIVDKDGTPIEKKNYTVDFTGTLTIGPKTVTSDMITAESVVYNGEAQTPAPVVKDSVVTDGDTTLEAGKDYTVLPYENNVNAGTATVTIEGMGNYTGTASASFTIEPKEVTVTAAGTKLFGAADPAQTETVENSQTVPTGDNWYQVQINGLVDKDKGQSLISAAVAREAGEVPGTYDITLTVDASKATNYKVKDLKDNTLVIADAFTLANKAAFTVVLGSADSEDDVNTHSASVGYTIQANDGQTLIGDLQSYADVALAVNAADRDASFVVPEPVPDPNATEPVTPNVPEVISQNTPTDDKTGSFAIPAVNYSAVGTDGTVMTWQSGLPVGTVLTVKVSPKGQDASAADALVVSDSKTVVTVPVTLAITPSSPDGMYTLDNGNVLLNANGTVTVSLAAAEGEAAPSEASVSGDWLDLLVGTEHWYFRWSDVATAFPAGGAIALPALLTALGDGTWHGNVPTGFLNIRVTLVDSTNHTVNAPETSVAFDVGGENSTQEVTNREQAESIEMNISDSVNADQRAAVSGTYGGSTPVMQATSGQQGTIVWNNVSAWKETPATLPHSGDSFTVQYRDLVGNTVTHTVNVARSNAVTSNTIFVQPIKDETVPGKALTFFGDTNVWEAGVLTIGSRTFEIAPVAGGETYDNSAKRWSQVVTLSDIGFPVGVPTVVSMAYEDLNGGEATISITYKDQAQTPVPASELVAGTQMLWGYVESGATVSVSVYHLDGSITQIPQENIAVDQFGYFFVRLGQTLSEGEMVSISTMDFCENLKSITLAVEDELSDNAFAEVLGANIVGEIPEDSATYHRFATPIDLGALSRAENKTMELPILAYKAIEIGRVILTLNDNGQVSVQYRIDAEDFIPEGARAYMSTYATRPEIQQLVKDTHAVVVQNLKNNPEGSLSPINVASYADGEGNYNGVVWLQAFFDIEMDEDNYISRGGRDTQFFRWLTESLQTESVLGAVYQNTSAYADNVAFYETYQRFEAISQQY